MATAQRTWKDRWARPALLIALLAGAGRAGAAPPPPAAAEPDLAALRREIFLSLERQDNERAAALIDRYLEHEPEDGAMLYNAACARCRLDRPEEAETLLLGAVRAGFLNFSLMRRDPDVASLRSRRILPVILSARDAADAIYAARREADWRRRFGEAYRLERDEDLRFTYASTLDAAARAGLREAVRRQSEQLRSSLFPGPRRHSVLIAVARPEDARRVFGDRNVRGKYQHGQRRLISSGTGRSLRHELVHVFHHHDMDRRGQQHPMWVQEGLACLYESWSGASGAPGTQSKFRANERDRTVADMLEAGEGPAWRALFAMDDHAFLADPRRHYALARSVLGFVAARSGLETWYEAYTAGFEDDPTGALAIETALGGGLDELETAWREWVPARGEEVEDVEIEVAVGALDAPDSAGENARVEDEPSPEPDEPDEIDLAYDEARNLYAVGAYEDAAAALVNVIELAPDHAEARYDLALTHLRSGDREQARAELVELDRLDPSLASLVRNLLKD